MGEIETLVDGMAFLEGPRWRDDGLYCSDQHGHQVMRIDLEGGVVRERSCSPEANGAWG